MVVRAIQHFESYINGMHFIIIIDYLALKTFKDKSILIGRLLRRVKKLMKYDFNINIVLILKKYS